MKYRTVVAALAAFSAFAAAAADAVVDHNGQTVVLEAGHASLQGWKLPAVPYPEGNEPTPARVELGKKLFFDPRLSGDGNMSCASCHNPLFGWSDGLPTAKGSKSQVLGRATPTVYNTAYNSLQMWDGRKRSLEDQALGPMEANVEMNADMKKLFAFLNGNAGYREAFAAAYPGQEIGAETVAKAIASFERTVVSADSPFDRWVAGDRKAMTPEQVKGFAVFLDPKKGNCAVCHSGANFTDNGFHNLGLASFGKDNPDMGRYAQKPLAVLKGAFKTPTVREAANTAPFFHDGSATTLMDVVEHYDRGGEVRTNVSKDVRPLGLTAQEKRELVAFMEALSTPPRAFQMSALPR
ncbi:cytochrome-c peroxidase [Piscinibacter defluvii]|uniref:cytochrome-c peroxidase n=1 Tax=Piscinibacter defluvii TaxID=1796922 RepID=UPI000FDDA629|nr:cytochrome c peroxidase [Piscinibacter defluvii]